MDRFGVPVMAFAARYIFNQERIDLEDDPHVALAALAKHGPYLQASQYRRGRLGEDWHPYVLSTPFFGACIEYKLTGETRFGGVATEYQYTGQYRVASLGLDWYNSRWYDSSLGRFAQADSVIPLASQGVQAWDRYAGMNNNPVRYNDPSGHDVGCAGNDAMFCGLRNQGLPLVPPGPTPPKPYSSVPIVTSTQSYIPTTKVPTPLQLTWNAPYTPPRTIGPNTNASGGLSPEAGEIIGEGISHLTNLTPVAIAGQKAAISSNPYTAGIGAAANGFAQWQRDRNLSLTTGQRLGRAAIVGIEDLVAAPIFATVANGAGISTATITGPSTPVIDGIEYFAGFVFGYSAAVSITEGPINSFNDNNMFPWLGLNPIR